MKKFHIIYKTTNIINGKMYIGKHSTNELADGYIGSGVVFTRALKKYGKENFVCDVLFVFDNEQDMNAKEREILTEEITSNPMYYNIATGGQGGNLGSFVNEKIGKTMSKILKGKSKSEQHKQALRETSHAKFYKPSDEIKKQIGRTVKQTWESMTSDERREKCGHSGVTNGFYGKTHKSDSLDKMRETIGDSRKGSLNPRAKSITVHDVTYTTYKECMKALGMNKKQFYKFLGEK